MMDTFFYHIGSAWGLPCTPSAPKWLSYPLGVLCPKMFVGQTFWGAGQSFWDGGSTFKKKLFCSYPFVCTWMGGGQNSPLTTFWFSMFEATLGLAYLDINVQILLPYCKIDYLGMCPCYRAWVMEGMNLGFELFIGNLNDMCESLWIKNPYIWELYIEEQIYTH